MCKYYSNKGAYVHHTMMIKINNSVITLNYLNDIDTTTDSWDLEVAKSE